MKLAILLALAVSFTATAANVPISNEVDRNAREAAQAAAALVRSVGYRCDSIDFFMRSSWDGDFHLTCNGNRYSYVLKDVGGRLQIEVR